MLDRRLFVHPDIYSCEERYRSLHLTSSAFEAWKNHLQANGFLYRDAYSFRLSIFHLGVLPSVEIVSCASMLFLLQIPCGFYLHKESYSHFVNFASVLIRRSCIGLSAIIYALYLAAKFGHSSTYKQCSFDLYSLLLVSLMVSCKFLNDAIFSNAFWASYSSLFSVVQINEFEREFLGHIQYDFWSLNLSVWHETLLMFFDAVKYLFTNQSHQLYYKTCLAGMAPQVATKPATIY